MNALTRNELARFVSFPTVSGDAAARSAMQACAAWLAARTRAAGFPDVVVVGAGGAPVVIGRWPVAPQLPTLLLYGHYDVAPADPARWTSGSPFTLHEAGRRLVGRGASDDKGFLLALLRAVGRVVRHGGGLPPVNLCCLWDGEEEIGSPTLRPLLAGLTRSLRADAAVVCDTEALPDGTPTLTVSQRGEITVDVTVTRSGPEVHSGRAGSSIVNPAEVLARLVASLRAPDGVVAIAGFTDDVRPPFGAHPAPGRSPALLVTGLGSRGARRTPHHVVPNEAWAQLNLRLVPDQEPGRILDRLTAHLARRRPPGVEVSYRVLLHGRPWVADTTHPVTNAAREAVRAVTGSWPAAKRSGGSIPALTALEDTGVVETAALLGFADPADAAHGPNESVCTDRLVRAERCVAELMRRYRRP